MEDRIFKTEPMETTATEQSTNSEINESTMKESCEPIIKQEHCDPLIKCESKDLSDEEERSGPWLEEEILYNYEKSPTPNCESTNNEVPYLSRYKESELTDKQGNHEQFFMKCERLENTMEVNSRITTLNNDIVQSFIKEEPVEANENDNCESIDSQGIKISSFNSVFHGNVDSTAPSPDGLNIIEVNNGVRSVTFLPEGTEFGPYPERNSEDAGSPMEEREWTSSLRESDGKEYNLKVRRREGQIYYKTVLNIQPGTELVLHAVNKHSKVQKCFTIADKPYQCLECGKRFSRAFHLERHNITHTREKPFICKECGTSFLFKSGLKQHMRSHVNESPYKCQVCGEWLTSKRDLKHHHQMSHTGDKPYKCLECGKCFARKPNLIQHARIHSGEKPYQCQQCGKSFANFCNLKHHQITHTGEKPYKCQECGRSFCRKNILKKHELLLHSESPPERPYECTKCGKCFITKGNLNHHQQTHSPQKCFKCLECGRGFTTKYCRNEHMYVHTGEKPFKCEQCGKCLSGKSNYTRHQLIHANAKTVENVNAKTVENVMPSKDI